MDIDINNLLLVISNESNTFNLSLNYCNEMEFIISSDDIEELKQKYIRSNVNMNNLITTFETSILPTYNHNKYDILLNSILFFSKIINKMHLKNNIKYNVIFCISRKFIKRAVIIATILFKNTCNSIKFIYPKIDMITIEDIINEENQVKIFYQSPFNEHVSI